MRARFTALAVLLALFGCAHGEGIAGVPRLEVNDELSTSLAEAAARGAEKGQDVVIDEDEVTYFFDAQGRMTRLQRQVVYLATEAGARSWLAIEAAFSPWYEDRPELRAVVRTPDGSLHVLDPATLGEAPERQVAENVYTDRRVVRGPLPAISAGATLAIETVEREHTVRLEGGDQHRIYLVNSAPTRRLRVIVDAPASLPLRWKVRGIDATPERRTDGDRQVVILERADLPAASPAPALLPPEVVRWPHLDVSTGADWANLARAYHRVVEDQLGNLDLSKVAGPLVADRKTRLERIDALVTWLHRQVRYTGVSFGEAGQVPGAPTQTLERRYGDCKDKGALLVALLAAADIPASLALLDDGPGEDVNAELPGFGRFDHAIVYVPGVDGGAPIWIDPTESTFPAGILPARDQGRLALVADPETTGLLKTPSARAEDHRYLETRRFILAPIGAGRVEETSEATGAIAATLRGDLAGLAQSDLEAWGRKYATDTYRGAFTDLKLTDGDPRAPVRIELSVEGVGSGFTDASEAAVNVDPAPVAQYLPEALRLGPPTPRTQPVRIPNPHRATLVYELVPPEGFVPGNLPEGSRVTLDGFKLARWFTVDARSGAVVARFEIDTGDGALAPENLSAVRAALSRLFAEPVIVTFEHAGHRDLREGRPRDGMVRYEAAAAGGEPIALARLARALLAAGLGERARAIARQATEKGPEVVFAWETLGYVLQHGPLGRFRAAGMDRDEAVAAYTRAVGLDPSDWSLRGDLAILLEHNADGTRYGSGASLAEAAAAYRHIRDELGVHELDQNYLYLLFAMEDFEALRTAAEDMDPSEDRNALLVAAVAATDGVDEARKTIGWLAGAAEARAPLTAGAAAQLLRARHYAEAGALFTDLGRTSGRVELLTLARVLDRASRPLEARLPPEDSPLSPLARFIAALAEAGDTLEREAVAPLFASRVRDRVGEKLESLDIRDLQARAAEAGGMPVPVLLELGLSSLDARTDGDPKVCVRIRAGVGFGGGQSMTVYVVPEDGGYRLLSVGEGPELAHEVLRHLRAHRLDAARQLMGWALEGRGRGAGEDPLSYDPSERIWSLTGGKADARTLHTLAALEFIRHQRSVEYGLLELGRGRHPDRRIQEAVQLARLRAEVNRENAKGALGAARTLASAHPESWIATASMVHALLELGRIGEARSRLAGWRKDHPDHLSSKRLEVATAIAAGQLPAAEALLVTLTDESLDDELALNELAWVRLFTRAPEEETLRLAERAARLGRYKSRPVLHTLATAYAELDRPQEALQVLWESLGGEGSKTPLDRDDWYVVGRIAETYGLTDEARSAYARVGKVEAGPMAALDTAILAARRLKGLGAE